ncbi:hypothetical protein [Runella slithyformis]|uniref:Response regulatory domain-containing protein n=1 Tax=Runella slithyformis (strain ATCC 29530 / DSM 19594 / LMG 11500 / NCIMB 11436 / LSU 4) TaxID=761193 RepID=A0A7U3ZN98_RUNSL|nr:hypothetical protein [Runella slithyformis]AEI50341.1 hypothetical protein Runsl_3988 [Runella slithyformis DSM 19594]
MLNATILLVKDHLNDIVAIEAMIEESDYQVMAVTAVESPDILQNPESRINLVICHYSQRGLFSGVQTKERDLSFILISDAYETMVLATESSQKIAYLNQPFSNTVLKTLIDLLIAGDNGR